MKTVKRKIEEYWNEIEFTPKEFAAFVELNSDKFGCAFWFDEDIRFTFDTGKEYLADDLVFFENGKIRASSNDRGRGLVKWDDEKDQYTHCFHFIEYELGQLVSVHVHEDDYKEITCDEEQTND